jgi:hypothetical protein
MKPKSLKYLFVIVALVFSVRSYATTPIPFSTTFSDCPYWNSYYQYGVNNYICPSEPNGLQRHGAWTCSGGETEELTTSANMSSGAGGSGLRHWTGTGKNVCSGSANIVFDSVQPELWIRWYQRYDSGQYFRSNSEGDKQLLMDSTVFASPPSGCGHWYGGWENPTKLVVQVKSVGGGSGINYYGQADRGWNYVMHEGATAPNGEKYSDGQWHYYEVHMKWNTGSPPDGNPDGIVQWWIDGELLLDHSDVVWYRQYPECSGWHNVVFRANVDYAMQSTCLSDDIDDIAISNTGYIGPLGYSVPVVSGCTISGGGKVQ